MGKFYAVAQGKSNSPLILESWDECKKEVIGCKGAIYKSFVSKKEAENFIALHLGDKVEGEEPENGVFIYVDGSFMEAKNNYSYGLVVVKDGEVIHKDKGVGYKKEDISLRNVAGEVMGSMKAIEYAINNDYKEITICYDYQGIECWAKGTWQRNKDLTKYYHEFMKKNMHLIQVNFKKIKGHSGDKYNDLADKLAKEALDNTNN